MRHRPVAGLHKTGQYELCDVLHHGLLADFHSYSGWQDSNRPPNRWRRSDRCFARKEPARTSQKPADLYWAGVGGSALETVALLFHRRSSNRYRAAAPSRSPFRQWPMAGYPKAFNIEMDPHEDL